MGAGPPFDAISKTTRALSGAQSHCKGSSTPTTPLLLNLLSFWWVLLQHFSFPMFCRSLFMMHLLMHLTQESSLLQLGIEQI